MNVYLSAIEVDGGCGERVVRQVKELHRALQLVAFDIPQSELKRVATLRARTGKPTVLVGLKAVGRSVLTSLSHALERVELDNFRGVGGSLVVELSNSELSRPRFIPPLSSALRDYWALVCLDDDAVDTAFTQEALPRGVWARVVERARRLAPRSFARLGLVAPPELRISVHDPARIDEVFRLGTPVLREIGRSA